MKIRVDTYYDLTCDGCCCTWSADFDAKNRCMGGWGNVGMGMYQNKKLLVEHAYATGWKCRGGRTLCPECAAKIT